MSSTESSGAPAEATATTPAPDAAFPTFGSSNRGSGLARGKGKRPSAPAAATAASTAYTPTAIEVVTAPREYTNPFAPVETPAPVTEVVAPAAVAPAPARPEPVERVAPVKAYSAPVVEQTAAAEAPADLSDEASAKSELNILEPEQQKHSPAQTWESEGFRPARAERSERPRREESRRDEPRRDEPRHEESSEQPAEAFDPASIPEKFLYVRPGHTYVPTPKNYGGAPRERNSAPREAQSPSASYSAPASSASASAPAAAESGGFLGWLKGLFGGSTPAAAPVTAGSSNSEARREGGEHRRHRGGRNRGGQGGGGEGGRGRGRGGRGRSGGGGGGDYRREGSSQGGV